MAGYARCAARTGDMLLIVQAMKIKHELRTVNDG